MKICLVCSSGGHLLELFRLADAWKDMDHFWVSFPGCDTDYLLQAERVIHAYHPTNRNVWNLLRNFGVAFRVLRNEKPTAIVSTGAGVAIPFFLLGRLLRIPTVYVESLTRIQKPSLTGRLIYPLATRFLVQWPELAQKYKKAEFGGNVL